ncbi:MAG: glycosyltransferase [Thiobacillus sp.]
MLNVLAIYPAFDPVINEMAMVWRQLCQVDRVRCTVVAGAVDKLKGQASAIRVENLPNLEIHRIPAAPASAEGQALIAALARKLKPDVIFCAVSHNMPAALEAQKAAFAPIVLHTEYFLDDTMGLPRRAYLGLQWLRPLVHRRFRQQLQRQSQLILCSNPVEFEGKLPESLAAKLQFLPWPHPHHDDEPGQDKHERNFSAYIGSIGRAKGALVLQRYFSALLNAMPDFRLSIVGPPTDKDGVASIEALRVAGGNRVDIRPHCPRVEALELISRSEFVLSPANRLGWGLLGDAWSSGTPVIAVGSHYDIRAGENCLIAEDSASFVDQVVRLQQDENLRKALVNAGYGTACRHSIAAVSAALVQGLELASPLGQGNRYGPSIG